MAYKNSYGKGAKSDIEKHRDTQFGRGKTSKSGGGGGRKNSNSGKRGGKKY